MSEKQKGKNWNEVIREMNQPVSDKQNYTRGRWTSSHPQDSHTALVSQSLTNPKVIAGVVWGAEVTEDEQRANADLIVTAVNQCIELNPSNPLAVAQNIGEMVKAIKTSIAELNDAQGEWVSVDETFAPCWTHLIKSAVSNLEAVLSVITKEG